MGFRDRDKDKDRYYDKDRDEKFPKKKKRFIQFEQFKTIDYKDVKFISRFVSERGKILPRRITGLNAQQQRKITKAIKRARQMSLLPYLSYTG